MVLMPLRRLMAVLLIALMAFAVPAVAHENHQREQIEQEEKAGAAGQPAAAPGITGEMMDHNGMEEQRPTTFSGRLVRWLGAMHPFAVHFPIALIPASWLALIVARRRGHAVDVIRAVIMLAGIAAVGAALLGWFNAGFSLTDRDEVLLAHRWVGTVLAGVVGAIGIWAWRRTDSVNSPAMMWILGGTTLLLLIQGWLGAAVTHGINHMMF